MNIVHLSDTHVGVRDNLSRLNKIVTTVISNYHPKDTVVLHTGDLIDSYSDANCALAKIELNRLHDAGYRVLMCPGNHDYGNSAYIDNAFARAYRALFLKEILGDRNSTFPVVNFIGDCAFIGLDTMQDEMGFFARLFADGNVGAHQRSKLTERIKIARSTHKKIIVYMHHHPFINGYSVRPDIGDPNMAFRLLQWFTRPFRRLKDAYSLMQILRDKVDILLFGHQHTGLNHAFEAERYGIKLALDGSSSTCMDMPMDDMHIRVIDTDTMTFTTLLIPI